MNRAGVALLSGAALLLVSTPTALAGLGNNAPERPTEGLVAECKAESTVWSALTEPVTGRPSCGDTLRCTAKAGCDYDVRVEIAGDGYVGGLAFAGGGGRTCQDALLCAASVSFHLVQGQLIRWGCSVEGTTVAANVALACGLYVPVELPEEPPE